MRALFVIAGVLVLVGCGQQRCTADSQCGDARVCAPSGICLAACASTAQCGAGQSCSTAGACVSPTAGCAVSADCAAGQVCAPGGQCQAMGVDAGPIGCGGEKFETTPTEANVLIVLDHSGSMQELISNNRSKWDTATAAVRDLTARHASGRLRFGLQLFSLAGAQCQAGQVVVNVGPGTVTAISTALPQVANGSGTPLGAALHVSAQSPDIADATRANFVLLLTDGMENCGGAPVAEVEGLFARGVRTYTVGFGSDVDANTLNQLAIKGGTARATAPRYFQADSPTELAAALGSIASGAASCDFTLTRTPPNPATLYVAVDGQFFPRDPSRVSGWDYQAQGNRVTLFGPACDLVAQRPGAKVSVVYGCPDDTLTETGPGGHLDAGFPGLPGDGGLPEIN